VSLDFKAVISLLGYSIRMKAGFGKYKYLLHREEYSMQRWGITV
jgi:hypothetical protein